MVRKNQTRMRPKVNAVPRRDIVKPETPTNTDDSFTTLLATVLKPILAVTFWFNPSSYAESGFQDTV